MRTFFRSSLVRPLVALAVVGGAARPLFAQEAAAGGSPNLLEPHAGLMVWTLIVFVLLLFVLGKFAFPKILGAVEARERALASALESAQRDREAVDLALAGATKVIGRNLDDAGNRRLVEDFLGTIPAPASLAAADGVAGAQGGSRGGR